MMSLEGFLAPGAHDQSPASCVCVVEVLFNSPIGEHLSFDKTFGFLLGL